MAEAQVSAGAYPLGVRPFRIALSAAVLAGATAVAFQLSTGSAAADEATMLPVTSAADLVVDAAHQRIFISDPTGGRLITTDYAGKVLATATGLPGVRDLLLTDRLYAAVPDAGTIVAFDAAGAMTTYPVGGAPSTLAAAAGKIWFGEAGHGLGSLDPSGAEPVVTHGADLPGALPQGAWWSSAPRLATTPAHPDLVAAVDPGISSNVFSLLDVSTDPPTAVATRDLSTRGKDLAFSPDGSRLVVTGIQSSVVALSSADLSTVESYTATDAFPGAVAVRADGTIAVAAGSDVTGAVALYTPGVATAAKRFDLLQALDADGNPISLSLTAPGSAMAWEPDGNRLFAVAVKSSTSASRPDPILTLQILNDVARTPVSVQLSVPATATPGRTYAVTGLVSTPVPAGLPLVITRTDPGTAGSRRVGPETVPASGQIRFDDVQPTAGTVTYTVSIPGNAEYTAASASASVLVASSKAAALTLDRNGTTWANGASVTFTARLGTTYRNRVVEIWADPAGSDQPNKLLRKASVDGSGKLTASLKLTRNTTVSAVFRGDDLTLAKTVKASVSTRASVTTTVARHYKTAKIGSTSYQYFRRTKNPQFTTTINPYPGRKQYYQIDVYRNGKWTKWSSGYYALNAAGKSVREVGGTHATGVRYRVRSAYVSAKSGDTANVTTYGAYRYFTFTK